MNQHTDIIIISSSRRAWAPWLFLILLTFTQQAFAHGGFDHVIGTVSKLESGNLIVRTAKGEVTVRLNDKTEITRNGQKAGAADLKPGTRVVVDIPEGSKDRMAHSVKVGVNPNQ